MGMEWAALEDFSAAVRNDPNNPECLIKRGSLYLVLEAPQKAIADLRKALRVAPANWRLRSDTEKYLKRAESLSGEEE